MHSGSSVLIVKKNVCSRSTGTVVLVATTSNTPMPINAMICTGIAHRVITMAANNPPREPTADECTHHAIVDGGVAIWYPQMGGYVGKAVAFACSDEPGSCIDVYVWHDGDFPFGGTVTSNECWCWCAEDPTQNADELCPCCKDKVTPHPKRPYQIHHCDITQFITFGETLNELLP